MGTGNNWKGRQETFDAVNAETTSGLTPLKKFSGGNGISVTVWKNSAKSKQGPFTYYAVQLQRRYQDSQGKWQTANTLREAHMPIAIDLLTQAQRFVANESKLQG
jgi:hypothetical protein